MSVGQNIRRLRFEAGIKTQKELADLIGVPQPQVSDWENDRYTALGTPTLLRIAKVLQCSLDQLLAGVDPDYDRVRDAQMDVIARPTRLDFSATAHAELPVVAEGDAAPRGMTWDGEPPVAVNRWVPRPGDLRDPDAYGVEVRGDAMFPVLRPRMVAIVAPGSRVLDGDDVYVELQSGERLLRIARQTRGGFVLEAYNNEIYPTRVVRRKDVVAMHAVMYWRRRSV